jgi:hypothetical protein
MVVSARLVSRALSDARSITTLQPNERSRAAVATEDVGLPVGRKSRFLAALGMTKSAYARIAPDRAVLEGQRSSPVACSRCSVARPIGDSPVGTAPDG